MMDIVKQMMNADEARTCVERIRVGIDGIRVLVLDLHEREGWRALGYDSWRVCVTTEFGQSQSRLYQLLTAAQIEREISTNVETESIPESHLRELAPLKDAADRRAAWAEASEAHGESLTAAKLRAVVDRYRRPVEDTLTHEELQATVAAGFDVFVQTTEAFARIYRSRLYRPEYATFERYCRECHNVDAAFVLDMMDILDMVRPAA